MFRRGTLRRGMVPQTANQAEQQLQMAIELSLAEAETLAVADAAGPDHVAIEMPDAPAAGAAVATADAAVLLPPTLTGTHDRRIRTPPTPFPLTRRQASCMSV